MSNADEIARLRAELAEATAERDRAFAALEVSRRYFGMMYRLANDAEDDVEES